MKNKLLISIIITIVILVALFFFLSWFGSYYFSRCLDKNDEAYLKSLKDECGLDSQGKITKCQNYPQEKTTYFKNEINNCYKKTQVLRIIPNLFSD